MRQERARWKFQRDAVKARLNPQPIVEVEDVDHDPLECDCGNPKDGCDDGCGRCSYLDGTRASDASVIAVLRVVTRATVAEIADQTRRARESVWRTLSRMETTGRVRRRHMTDGTSGEFDAAIYSLSSPARRRAA